MANTLDFTVSLQTRSGSKRPIEDVTDIGENTQAEKRVRAILTILDQFSNKEELDEVKEVAMIAHSIKHDIPIPINYNKAIQDPRYSKQQKEAIQYKIGQLLVNNTYFLSNMVSTTPRPLY